MQSVLGILREVSCGVRVPPALGLRLRLRSISRRSKVLHTTLRILLGPELTPLRLPWTGTRFGLIAFTSSKVGSIDPTTRQQLNNLGFRLPKTAAVAGSARCLSRPTACDQGGFILDHWWKASNHVCGVW